MRHAAPKLDSDQHAVASGPQPQVAMTRALEPSLHHENVYDPVSGLTISIWSPAMPPRNGDTLN